MVASEWLGAVDQCWENKKGRRVVSGNQLWVGECGVSGSWEGCAISAAVGSRWLNPKADRCNWRSGGGQETVAVVGRAAMALGGAHFYVLMFLEAACPLVKCVLCWAVVRDWELSFPAQIRSLAVWVPVKSPSWQFKPLWVCFQHCWESFLLSTVPSLHSMSLVEAWKGVIWCFLARLLDCWCAEWCLFAGFRSCFGWQNSMIICWRINFLVMGSEVADPIYGILFLCWHALMDAWWLGHGYLDLYF